MYQVHTSKTQTSNTRVKRFASFLLVQVKITRTTGTRVAHAAEGECVLENIIRHTWYAVSTEHKLDS